LGELKPLQNEGVLKFLHIIVKKSKQENKKYIYYGGLEYIYLKK
jgi:hypothetical protein